MDYPREQGSKDRTAVNRNNQFYEKGQRERRISSGNHRKGDSQLKGWKMDGFQGKNYNRANQAQAFTDHLRRVDGGDAERRYVYPFTVGKYDDGHAGVFGHPAGSDGGRVPAANE
jgi:hypothetical protein